MSTLVMESRPENQTKRKTVSHPSVNTLGCKKDYIGEEKIWECKNIKMLTVLSRLFSSYSGNKQSFGFKKDVWSLYPTSGLNFLEERALGMNPIRSVP